MAWQPLAANKMRTLLTMLGIIIGIASVVSIVVVGDAAKQMVLADIRSIGTNTIDVYPGKDFGDDDPQYQQALKYDDLIAIQKQPWVASATPAVSQNLRLRYNNVDVAASANGVSGDYFNVYGMTFSEGNTFNQEQLNGRAQVVVLDGNTRRQLFPHKADVVDGAFWSAICPPESLVWRKKNSRCLVAVKCCVSDTTLLHDVGVVMDASRA